MVASKVILTDKNIFKVGNNLNKITSINVILMSLWKYLDIAFDFNSQKNRPGEFIKKCL